MVSRALEVRMVKTYRWATGIGESRIVSMRPYASTRVFNWTCIWLAWGAWNIPLSWFCLMYLSTKKVNCNDNPRAPSSKLLSSLGKRSLYSFWKVELPVVGLMPLPGMTAAPHSARRWFLVEYKIAISILTTRSVSARSASLEDEDSEALL